MSFWYQLLFVAVFLAASGRFDPSDRCLVYFSVLHDLCGRFRDQQTLGKGGFLAILVAAVWRATQVSQFLSKNEKVKDFGSEWEALTTREVRIGRVGQPTEFSAGVRLWHSRD